MRPPAERAAFSDPSDTFELVFRRLANGAQVDDAYFDRIYPDWARELSRIHWTPIPVARRAVELLLSGPSGGRESRRERRILDVGAGVGKFCFVGAAVSGARFTGIEQRPHFVALCRALVAGHRLPRLDFRVGDLSTVDWNAFEGIYLYNPFQEHLTPYERLDSSVVLDRRLHRLHVQEVEARLGQLAPGIRVATYHGFGGRIPGGFRLLAREFCFRGPVECWERL